MKKIICYLCKSKKKIIRPGSVRDNKKLKIFECLNCGLVYLSSKKHIKKLHYQKSGMHDGKKRNINFWLKETRNDDKRRYNLLKKLVINKKILDFGCGAGGFLDLISKHAKEANGVELEEALEKSFIKRNLKVFKNYNLAIQSKKKWDIVTAFHVVEHLSDPIKVLSELTNLLSKNGKLYIEVPNSEDALLTLYQNKAFQNFTYWSQHLYLFNSNNLKKIAKKIKLKVDWIKYVQRYSLSNHLYWLSKGKPAGHKVWHFLENNSLNKNYEKQLALNGLTDTIIICLRK